MENEIFQAPPQSVEPSLTVEGYSPPSESPDLGLSEAPPPPPSEESFFSPKTIIFFILVMAIIGGVIFAVYNFLKKGETARNGKVSLTYWGLWEPKAAIEPFIAEYMEKHPNVAISYEMQSITEYRERLQAAIARGEGPDIFRYHNTWLSMLRESLASLPNEVMKPEDFQKTFYPVAQEDLLFNNKFYGIPLEIDGLLLYYNKDLLSNAGYNTYPRDWKEFEEMSAKMTVKDGYGKILTAGAAMGLSVNIEHFSDILGLIFYQNGADFSNLTADPAVQALTYYSLFAQKPNNVWDEYLDNSIVAFAGGKVGFIFAPSWQIFNIKSLSPNLNFTVAPVPQLEGGTPVSWANYWVEGVSAKSKFQKEAFAFLNFLSSKDVMTKMFSEQTKGARFFGEPYSRVDLASTANDSEYLAPLLSQAPQMRSWYLSSRTFDNGINDKIIKYFENAVTSISQGSSPQGALEGASNGVNQVLSEYGK